MDENEFKKLDVSNQRWKIYQLLSERSKEVVGKDLAGEKCKYDFDMHSSVCQGCIWFEECSVGNDPKSISSKPAEPKGETTVHESIVAEVGIITQLAVGVINHDGSEICWIPKSAISNLDKIAIEQGKTSELVIVDWFQPKVEWVKNKPRG